VIRILLIAILILLLARAFWRIVDGILEAAGGTPRRPRGAARPGRKLVRDPVCGTFVAPGAVPSLQVRGETYHFCSDQCRSNFERSSR
jgi:YHS domain-containing protein